MLAYYDDEVNDAVVDEKYLSDGTGETFVEYLYYHIEGLIPESYAEDVRNGLNWYLEEVELDNLYYARTISDAAFSEYTSLIYSDTPAIVGLYDHSTYGDHWVVGYGVDIQVPPNPYITFDGFFAIVNDGWGNNGVRINWNYVDHLVYIE